VRRYNGCALRGKEVGKSAFASRLGSH